MNDINLIDKSNEYSLDAALGGFFSFVRPRINEALEQGLLEEVEKDVFSLVNNNCFQGNYIQG